MSTLPSNALVTRKQVKDYMRINAADNELDNLINDLIGRVSQLFQSYCGRNFVAQDYIEYYDGQGRDVLFLDNYPVNSVASVYDDTDWEWNSEDLIESTEYKIADKRFIVFDTLLSNARQNVKVTYNAGFSSIPDDLQQACIEEVGRKIKHRTDFDEVNKTLSDGSVVYQDQNFLPQTVKVLNKYRMKAVL